MAKTNPQQMADENKSLKEQIELLKARNKLQEESFDISSAAVDSLKEILGIQSRSSTFEKATLNVNKEINKSIMDQKTGLSNINTIQRQIQKNEDLLNKSRLVEQGLLSSIGNKLSKGAKIVEGRIAKQAEQNRQLNEYNKRIEEGVSIDMVSYNQLKQKIALNENLISQEFGKLSPLEQQLLLTKQNTKELEKQQVVRKAEESLQKNLESRLGLAGKLSKSLGAIPGIGQASAEALAQVTEEIQKQLEATGKLPSRWKTFSMIAGKTISSLGKGLTDPLFIITSLVGIFKDLDQSAGDYAKSMNMSYSDALKARNEFTSMAVASGDMALNAKGLMETQTAIGAQLGTNAKLNQADLKTFTKLREQAGYTNEELMGIQQLSLVNGKSLEQNTKEILGGAKAYSSRNKLVVNEKQVLKEVSKASAALKLSLGGSTKAIAEAVVKAKQFGLTLEQTEKMSQSLLNFEDSIESELSAELLTGKNLNFERARGLALNGKTAEAAAEIAAQVGSSAEFGKMNVIQQEAIAKSVGMERNELAQSLIDKEALAKIGFKDAAAAKAKYDTLRKTMTAEQAAAKLGDDELAKQYEQQSNAEKFAQAMERVKEIFVSIVDGPMSLILEGLSTMLSSTKVIYGVTGLIAGIYAGKMVSGIIQTIVKIGAMTAANTANAAAATAGAAAVSFGSILPIILGGVGAVVGLLASLTADDLMSAPPGYGKRTLLGPEGAIQLNDKDTVIAGTNLFGDDVKSSPGKSTEMAGKGAIKIQSGGGNDTAAIISAINALSNRPINISIDGKKVIEATTGAQPNTQGDESRKNSYQMS
jgi:hypothetical protein